MQPRRLPLAKREAVKTEIDRLLNDGIIDPSNGPWASQTVLVTKPDGTSRLCIDYRKLNDVTRKDSYPLLLISDSLDFASGNRLGCILNGTASPVSILCWTKSVLPKSDLFLENTF
jgi:hypothetical protein